MNSHAVPLFDLVYFILIIRVVVDFFFVAFSFYLISFFDLDIYVFLSKKARLCLYSSLPLFFRLLLFPFSSICFVLLMVFFPRPLLLRGNLGSCLLAVVSLAGPISACSSNPDRGFFLSLLLRLQAVYVVVMQNVSTSNRFGYDSLLKIYRETDLSQEKTRILGLGIAVVFGFSYVIFEGRISSL